jgi:hypothetical protein
MNDFLDTDKIATPFWGFIAFIVAMDIIFRKKKNQLDELEAKN